MALRVKRHLRQSPGAGIKIPRMAGAERPFSGTYEDLRAGGLPRHLIAFGSQSGNIIPKSSVILI
jgi:hypothetical protein